MSTIQINAYVSFEIEVEDDGEVPTYPEDYDEDVIDALYDMAEEKGWNITDLEIK